MSAAPTVSSPLSMSSKTEQISKHKHGTQTGDDVLMLGFLLMFTIGECIVLGGDFEERAISLRSPRGTHGWFLEPSRDAWVVRTDPSKDTCLVRGAFERRSCCSRWSVIGSTSVDSWAGAMMGSEFDGRSWAA